MQFGCRASNAIALSPELAQVQRHQKMPVEAARRWIRRWIVPLKKVPPDAAGALAGEAGPKTFVYIDSQGRCGPDAGIG